MTRWGMFERKQAQIAALRQALEGHRNGQRLKSPEASIHEFGEWVAGVLGAPVVRGVLETVETETKYSGYIAQQERQMARLAGSGGRRIPADFVYKGIAGLSREVWEKLERVRPETLGQAARIPGVTPAAIALLDVHMSLAHVS